jgi:hypothetical protein
MKKAQFVVITLFYLILGFKEKPVYAGTELSTQYSLFTVQDQYATIVSQSFPKKVQCSEQLKSPGLRTWWNSFNYYADSGNRTAARSYYFQYEDFVNTTLEHENPDIQSLIRYKLAYVVNNLYYSHTIKGDDQKVIMQDVRNFWQNYVDWYKELSTEDRQSLCPKANKYAIANDNLFKIKKLYR